MADFDLSKLRIDEKDQPHPVRPKLPQWAYGLVVLLALSIIALMLFSPRSSPSPTSSAISDSAAKSVAVQNRVTSAELHATGYVVAQRKAAVSSKATGRLRELRVEEGDKVARNDIIAVLENEDLAAIRDQANANVATLRAKLLADEAEQADAVRNFDRIDALLKQKVVARADWDSAKARKEKAVAAVASSQASITFGLAQLKKAEVDLDYSYIRAPFDGTVLTKNADVGEVVAPFGSSTNARAAVVTLADMASLEVEADVSESQVSKIKPPGKVEIVLDSYPEKRYRGEISKIVPTVDRAKATVLIKIKFLDIDDRALPDMSAKITFYLNEDAST